MTDIGTIIGWKFNHQAGMKTKAGVITAFPGDIPSQAEQDAWIAEYEATVPKENKKIEVKTEARRRILEIVPDWKQSNLNARMNELNKKVSIDGGTLTADELAEVAAMHALWDQAKSIRNKSDALESVIAGMTTQELEDLKVADNIHWE